MLSNDWRTQWDRVGRRLDDVRAVYRGRPGGTASAVDDVQCFFEAVHHLRDWLGNDASSGVSLQDGKHLIDSNPALRRCADIANASKHFTLATSRTGDPLTTIARNDVTVFVNSDRGSSHKFYIASDGAEYDVLETAEEAVEEWTRFLTRRGLI